MTTIALRKAESQPVSRRKPRSVIFSDELYIIDVQYYLNLQFHNFEGVPND
jgi:hypothetical protein